MDWLVVFSVVLVNLIVWYVDILVRMLMYVGIGVNLVNDVYLVVFVVEYCVSIVFYDSDFG